MVAVEEERTAAARAASCQDSLEEQHHFSSPQDGARGMATADFG
jgi:hypothetical protein